MTNLKTYTCLDGYNKIKETLGDSYDNLNEEYKGYLEELRDASSEFVVNKYEMDVNSISDVTLKQVIGANGYYFILTTRNNKLDFIWHNRESKRIEFWGPASCIKNAVSIIQSRINKHSSLD